ncbi:hypothetical protein THEYE_A1935 [Thermodesulfovibrio yellowstonii DSM 11347]|uniref:Uncharacterized protein n=1 Tax=Thermodesulfovibrio yellowstonii (strain ATCC 51303 / DSM 11347 / YP87) TaxID=289376 RepID=B5YI94_THEYD|nr:hypothetical protein THEYE_A1935 [Thermodesulfovibrio yellowstonii DSM 11347]
MKIVLYINIESLSDLISSFLKDEVEIFQPLWSGVFYIKNPLVLLCLI